MVYGFCLEDAGVAAVGVQSEAVELGESLGAGMLVDGARIGLVESMTQLTAQTGDIPGAQAEIAKLQSLENKLLEAKDSY